MYFMAECYSMVDVRFSIVKLNFFTAFHPQRIFSIVIFSFAHKKNVCAVMCTMTGLE